MSIPVICDRCRATGVSGEADFSHLGDLLEFDPVPRKTQRADGWTPERQRAFIAALSATGSKRTAAISIGMAPFGVDQLLKAEGNAGFKAAFDRAVAIAQANGSLRIAQGVADAAARNAQLAPPPSRLRGYRAQPDPEMSDDHKWDLMHSVGIKFMKKVAAERRARLAGEIVAADFYLRQVTVMEVLLDLMSTDFGFDAQSVIRQLRRGEHSLQEIASTWLSDWMDRSRRMWWEQEGEPERPPHPDTRFLRRRTHDDGDYATQVDQHTAGKCSDPAYGYTQEEWTALTTKEQWAARERVFREEAEEQRRWESGRRSSVISHFITQGMNSAKALRTYGQVKNDFLDHIKGAADPIVFEQIQNDFPHGWTVEFKFGDAPTYGKYAIPFFSRVTLDEAKREIEALGFKAVEVSFIRLSKA